MWYYNCPDMCALCTWHSHTKFIRRFSMSVRFARSILIAPWMQCMQCFKTCQAETWEYWCIMIFLWQSPRRSNLVSAGHLWTALAGSSTSESHEMSLMSREYILLCRQKSSELHWVMFCASQKRKESDVPFLKSARRLVEALRETTLMTLNCQRSSRLARVD